MTTSKLKSESSSPLSYFFPSGTLFTILSITSQYSNLLQNASKQFKTLTRKPIIQYLLTMMLQRRFALKVLGTINFLQTRRRGNNKWKNCDQLGWRLRRLDKTLGQWILNRERWRACVTIAPLQARCGAGRWRSGKGTSRKGEGY